MFFVLLIFAHPCWRNQTIDVQDLTKVTHNWVTAAAAAMFKELKLIIPGSDDSSDSNLLWSKKFPKKRMGHQ